MSNYINLFDASLTCSEVTLQTSHNFPGSYMVIVENIKDLAGNVISQTANSAEHTFIPLDSLIMLPAEDVY